MSEVGATLKILLNVSHNSRKMDRRIVSGDVLCDQLYLINHTGGELLLIDWVSITLQVHVRIHETRPWSMSFEGYP